MHSRPTCLEKDGIPDEFGECDITNRIVIIWKIIFFTVLISCKTSFQEELNFCGPQYSSSKEKSIIESMGDFLSLHCG